jgi:hypothetical protein
MDEPPNFGGDAGQPVLPVAADDLKTAFEIFLNQARLHPGGGSAISVGIFARGCKCGSDVHSVVYRAMMLQSLLRQGKEQIAPWMKDGQPDERVFWEFARFPVEWMGVGIERNGLPFDADEFFRRLRSQNFGMEPRTDRQGI